MAHRAVRAAEADGLAVGDLPAVEWAAHALFGHWSRRIGDAVQLPGPAGELDGGAFHMPARPPLRSW
jgi:hypothetical protein